jgi:hypothetical protein
MKSFLLHDGEDDTKTKELHAFLEPLCGDGSPNSWEGDNHGLSLWLIINIGDTMIMRDDGSFRVLPKNQPVAITKHSFPMTHAAMLLVEYDSGAHHVNRIVGDGTINLEQFLMPYSYGVDKLVKCEAALHQLMARTKNHVFEDLVIGDEIDQLAIIEKYKTEIPDLVVAHTLVNDWFNAWEDSAGVQHNLKGDDES